MGETDFLLKIVAHDWDDFEILTSRLTPAQCQPCEDGAVDPLGQKYARRAIPRARVRARLP